MGKIKMIVFDIDGVITDGRIYFDDEGKETKSVSLKDLDAFHQLHDAGYMIGCISGEDTHFSRKLVQILPLDYAKLGCKSKTESMIEIEEMLHISSEEICYIGDGKYDIPVLKIAGLAVCPFDAIEEVKSVADRVLCRKGGEGCIAEVYTLLMNKQEIDSINTSEIEDAFALRYDEHKDVLNTLIKDKAFMEKLAAAIQMINRCYQNDGTVFFCGNGGSAADAQHLAAELIGRFYLERRALRAEALTVNTSVITALANDYDYDMIFARQLEGRGTRGDVLIGITTSGRSKNILQAFQKAKELGMYTILLTGKVADDIEILRCTDCLLDVPSENTPRIQEAHILIGHFICEIVEINNNIKN